MHIDSIHRKEKKNTNLHIIHRDTSLSKLTSTQTLRETKDAQVRHGTSIKNIGHDLISKDAMAWTTNSVLKKQIHAQQNCWGETSSGKELESWNWNHLLTSIVYGCLRCKPLGWALLPSMLSAVALMVIS